VGGDPLAGWLRGGAEHELLQGATARSAHADREETVGQPAPGTDPWDSGGPAPRRRLSVLAAVPWAAAAVLGALVVTATPGLPGDLPSATLPRAPNGDTGERATTAPDGAPSPGMADAAPGAGAEAGGAGFEGGGDGAARDAVVLRVGELAVRGALAGGEVGQRYADHAVATGVEWAGELAVVRVAALVLEGDDQRWQHARVGWWAAPVRAGPAGPVPAGAPWPLSPPPGGPAPVADHDPAVAAAVVAALEQAGHTQVIGARVGRDPALPGLLSVTATTRGPDGTTAPRELWLAEGPPPAVLGMTTTTTTMGGGQR